MAAQADGSVYINTELDPEGFKAGSDRMKNAVKSLEAQVKALGPKLKSALRTGDFQDYANSTDQVTAKISEMEKELDALGRKKVATDAYTILISEADKAGAALERLLNRKEQLENRGVPQSSQQMKNLEADIALASSKYDELIAKKKKMEQSGDAYKSGTQTEEYAQLKQRIEEARAKQEELNEAARQGAVEIARKAQEERAAQAAAEEARRLKEEEKEAARQAAEETRRTKEEARAAAEEQKRHAQAVKESHARAQRLRTALASALGTTKSLILGNKNYKKSFSGLISNAKKFALSMLGARGIYAILRKAVSAYLDANQELKSQLSGIWTSLGNLLGPIIERIISLVTTALSYVTAFLKLLGLSGKAAAKSMKDAGSAAEKAQKTITGFDELNTMQDNKSSGGGSSGDTAAAIADAQLPDWVKSVIDNIKNGAWAEAATILTDKLNEMVMKVPWAEIGTKIGYYLNGALTFLATAITNFDWLTLGAKLATGVNAILTSVNWANLGTVLSGRFRIILLTAAGFLLNLDWGALASGFSAFAISFFNGIAGAIAAVDWAQLGRNLATFLQSVDWAGVATALFSALGTALGALGSFIRGLLESAWNAGVQWWKDTAGPDGEMTIGEFLNGILTALANVGEWVMTNIINPFMNALVGEEKWAQMKEVGKNVVEGLWQGIKDFLADPITWLKTNLIDPIVNGVKSLLGIQSPSTVFAEIGGYIIEGLLNGLKEAWGTITEWFAAAWEGIRTTAETAWEGIKTTVSTAWSSVKTTCTTIGTAVASKVSDSWTKVKGFVTNNLETAKKKASTAWSSIKSTASSIGSSIGSAASTAWSKVKGFVTDNLEKAKTGAATAWNNIKSTTSSIVSAVSSNVSTAWSKVKGFVTDNLTAAKNNASAAWNSIKSTATSIGTAISSSVSSVWTNIKTSITTNLNNAKTAAATAWSNMKTTVTTTVSNIKTEISSKFESIYSTINSKISSAKSAVSTGFTNIKSSITTNISSAMSTLRTMDWSSIGSNIVSGISNGLNNSWYWLRNQASSLASNLLSSVKGWLGIASPSKVFRDEVGWFIGLGIGEGIDESERPILKTVSGVADAISEEFSNGDYDISIPASRLDGTLATFSDKITDSFSRLMERLQSIADSVTFATPAMAGGVAPYMVNARSSASNPPGYPIFDGSGSDLGKIFELISGKQNALLREQIELLRQLLDKDPTVEVTTSSIASAAKRKNLRDGKTTFPVDV